MPLAERPRLVLERDSLVVLLLIGDCRVEFAQHLTDLRKRSHNRSAIGNHSAPVARFLIHLDVSVFNFLVTSMRCEFAREQTQSVEMVGSAAD